MESSNGVKSTGSSDFIYTSQATSSVKISLKASSASAEDSVNVGMDDIYKSLTILGDKVIAKLDELLKADVPGGIASLSPEQHTPEATAQRIVDGTTALFSIYARQHKDMEGEELFDSFMETIRKGIKQGYNDAMGTLGDIGALKIGGVQEGISETMRLVEEKLQAFEENYRQANFAKEEKVEEGQAETEQPA